MGHESRDEVLLAYELVVHLGEDAARESVNVACQLIDFIQELAA